MSRLWRWIRDKMSGSSGHTNDDARNQRAGDSGITPPLNPLVAALTGVQKDRIDKLQKQGLSVDEQQTLGHEVRDAVADLPELVTFAGFSAGTLRDPTDPAGREWPALFLNAQLSKWLLIEPDGLVHHQTFEDPAAPDQKRDVFWVKADATIRWGSETRSGAGRFLRGQFTSAGDYSASVSGGTVNAATGIFCQVPTPGCCGYRSHN